MANITLRVNGRAHTVNVEPSTPLLYILRNDLGLQGPRFGCGLGQCGACTVIINGKAAMSCAVAIHDLEGADVTTIEGLGPGAAHPVQQAWLAEQVTMCGYCEPGFIMAIAALLEASPNPTDEQIAALPHICRCGAYVRIRKAIRRAAQAGVERAAPGQEHTEAKRLSDGSSEKEQEQP